MKCWCFILGLVDYFSPIASTIFIACGHLWDRLQEEAGLLGPRVHADFGVSSGLRSPAA